MIFTSKSLFSQLTRSHLSTHLAWNSWEQGRTRSSWRSSKSHMHTTQDDWSPGKKNKLFVCKSLLYVKKTHILQIIYHGYNFDQSNFLLQLVQEKSLIFRAPNKFITYTPCYLMKKEQWPQKFIK